MKKTFLLIIDVNKKKPSHSSPKSKYDYLIKNIYDDCIVKNPLILTSIQKREYGRYFSLLTIVGL
jgi:hypothetical protein